MSKTEGFTLIEIIVTITISAVLGAFFVQYMGSAFMGSGKSVSTLKETYAINQVIAKVTAGYRNELDNGTLNLSDFKDDISNSNYDENGVTCSGMFLNYRSAGNLIDTNSDGIIEPEEETSVPTKFLLVTASKDNRSMRMLLTVE